MDLVTNRTADSVYGYFDLNRVEAAVQSIAENFPSLGIGISLDVKTDWNLPEDFSAENWPTHSQMNRYLGNVLQIKKLFPNSIRLPSTMNGLTWTGANNIEKVLQVAFTRIEGIKQTYHYSGEIFAGEE